MEYKYSFSGNLKRYLGLSGILFVLIIIFLFIFGIQLDIQFRGGSIVTYAYAGDVDMAQFSNVIADTISGVNIQQSTDVATGAPTFVVSLPGNESIDVERLAAITEQLRGTFPDSDIRTLEITNVDATIGREFLLKCICALVLAVVLVLLYVAWRFRKIGGFSAGAMGVVALVHDCIIVFGVFVIFRIPINANFIAVILTILGYSLNDTIVIYDRIRENKRLHGAKLPVGDMVNLSINQSMVRSINTSVTTVISMVVVTVVALVAGVDSIFSFSFPLILGLISGTYSSLCLAGPLWVKWQERKLHKKTA